MVLSTANIYAAGRDAPPAPGSGGGGTLPPVVELPSGSARVVTFPTVTGRATTSTAYSDYYGPNGDEIGPSDVRSFEGIAGIVHRANHLFLVGVFLTDEEPSNPAPERLNFTDPNQLQVETDAVQVPRGQEFGELALEIGQVFFVGDGKGHTFVVPDEATRLFLGFADARLNVGCPGYYGNNAGKFTVEVKVATE